MRCDSHYQGGWQGVSKTRWVMTSTLLRWRLRGAVFTGNWSWWEFSWDPWPHYHPTWAGNSMGLLRMHRDTHMPWGMSGSLIRGGGENVHGILGACAFTSLRIWQEAHVKYLFFYTNQGLLHLWLRIVSTIEIGRYLINVMREDVAYVKHISLGKTLLSHR